MQSMKIIAHILFRNIQKKMQSMEGSFDACTEDLFNQTIKVQ